LITLHTFREKSGQVPDKSGLVVLADFEQQFNPSLALMSAVGHKLKTEKRLNYENWIFDRKEWIN
jgi:hypothetical protein